MIGGIAAETVHGEAVRVDDNILPQAFKLAVSSELVASVITGGAVRQHLDNQAGEPLAGVLGPVARRAFSDPAIRTGTFGLLV